MFILVQIRSKLVMDDIIGNTSNSIEVLIVVLIAGM